MSYTKSADGRTLHFPESLKEGPDGVLLPMPDDRLRQFAGEVREDDLLLFARRLVDGARKRRRQPRYAALNQQRLKLAKLCLARMVDAA